MYGNDVVSVKLKYMKLEITVAQVAVEANAALGRPAKSLEYLVIGEGEKKVIVQCGRKTYDGVQELLMEQGTGPIIGTMSAELTEVEQEEVKGKKK